MPLDARSAWTAHKGQLRSCTVGVAAGLVAAFLLVFADNLFEEGGADPGDFLVYAAPVLAALAAVLAVTRPAWRVQAGCLAHTTLVLYPFLLPAQPWWSIGGALAVHVLALLLETHAVTRLAVAVTGWPLLLQAAYRDDLGAFNPALAGLLFASQLLLLWGLLPQGRWRRIPQALLAASLGLVCLLALYSLSQDVERDRVAAAALAGAGAYAVASVGRWRLRAVSLPSIRWPALNRMAAMGDHVP